MSVCIVSGARTPVGGFNKSLSTLSASDLGGIAIKEALQRSNVGCEEVSLCVMGQVLYADEGQCPARQAAHKAGIPFTTPSYNVNMVCGSGMMSLISATQHVQCNPQAIVVAGGQESMSKAPHTMHVRAGKPMGDMTCKDTVVGDALTCKFNDYHMGITAENVAERYNISREDQDLFALYSQDKASQAMKSGVFEKEIVPVTVTSRRTTVTVDTDEHPRECTLGGLAKLRPCFKPNGGTVTAGNASGINDGAAACVLMSRVLAQQRGLLPLGTVITSAQVGCDPAVMGMGPVGAIQSVLEKTGWTVDTVDLFEINEAFAAQSVAVVRELKIDVEKVNVNGGAIALGHPVGMSGTRIVLTLLYQLARSGKRRGVAALCVGGGMGVAMAVERM